VIDRYVITLFYEVFIKQQQYRYNFDTVYHLRIYIL